MGNGAFPEHNRNPRSHDDDGKQTGDVSDERAPTQGPGPGWAGGLWPYLFQLGRALVTSLSEQVPGPAGVSLPVRGVNVFCPRALCGGVAAWRGQLAAHVPGTWADRSTHKASPPLLALLA